MRPGRMWYAAMALTVAGFALSPWIGPWPSIMAAGIGGAGLIAMAFRRGRVHRRPLSAAAVVAGAGAVVALIALDALEAISHARAVAWAGIGIQAVYAGLRMPRRRITEGRARTVVPMVGHAFAIGGLSLIWQGEDLEPTALLAAMLGFTVLSMDLVWMRRQANPQGHQGQSLEALLLALTALLLGAADVLSYLALDGTLPFPAAMALEPMLGVVILSGLAIAAGPPPLPPRMKLRPGGVGEFWTDSIAFFVLLETVLFLFLYRLPDLVWPLFFLLTALLLVSVVFEYLSAAVAWGLHVRRRHDDPVLVGPLPPVTLLVSAKNEPTTLATTLPRNIEALPGAQVLLAYAAPDPATTAMLQGLKAEYPGRVDGVRCVGVSKATDLN